MKSPLYFKKLEWRESRNKPKHAIEIHGPRRYYDFALFCCDHNNEAEEFAAEWTAELIDALEAGEEASVQVRVREWNESNDSCCECDGDQP